MIREAIAGVAVVAVAMTVVLGLFVSRSLSRPEPIAKANRIISFETQWAAAEMTAFNTPRRVTIERVVQPAVLIEGATEAPQATEPPLPVAKPRKTAQLDICRGKGRVYYRNGKTWRCKR